MGTRMALVAAFQSGYLPTNRVYWNCDSSIFNLVRFVVQYVCQSSALRQQASDGRGYGCLISPVVVDCDPSVARTRESLQCAVDRCTWEMWIAR
jgi:hypothetical protein